MPKASLDQYGAVFRPAVPWVTWVSSDIFVFSVMSQEESHIAQLLCLAAFCILAIKRKLNAHMLCVPLQLFIKL